MTKRKDTKDKTFTDRDVSCKKEHKIKNNRCNRTTKGHKNTKSAANA